MAPKNPRDEELEAKLEVTRLDDLDDGELQPDEEEVDEDDAA